MKVNLEMLVSGILVLGISVGTMESNSNRFSMRVGIALAVLGFGLLFFSNEQCRNPVWLKRQIKHLIWKYWPLGS